MSSGQDFLLDGAASDACSTPAAQVGKRRRAATRARICALANALFYDKGYSAVTMDEIANAAGIRRSTLYLHFGDKEQILDAIAEDYTYKLRPVVDLLPGPVPTFEQIETWVGQFAEFVTTEQAATELLVSLSHLPNAPQAAIRFGEALKRMMAEQLAAFSEALEPGNTLALAWGIMAMDSLGWALCAFARNGGNEIARARLAVSTQQLHNFVQGDF